MRKTNILVFILSLAIVFSTWTPAAASSHQADTTATSIASGTAPLTIHNPLPKGASITLRGTKDYVFYVPPGQTITKTIDKGTYRYKYEGCLSKTTTGILKYTDGKYAIDIKACKMIKWVIFNPSLSRTFTGELKGWMSYQLKANPRQMQTYEVIAGPYVFNYSCGDKEYSIKVKPTKSKYWVMCN